MVIDVLYFLLEDHSTRDRNAGKLTKRHTVLPHVFVSAFTAHLGDCRTTGSGVIYDSLGCAKENEPKHGFARHSLYEKRKISNQTNKQRQQKEGETRMKKVSGSARAGVHTGKIELETGQEEKE